VHLLLLLIFGNKSLPSSNICYYYHHILPVLVLLLISLSYVLITIPKRFSRSQRILKQKGHRIVMRTLGHKKVSEKSFKRIFQHFFCRLAFMAFFSLFIVVFCLFARAPLTSNSHLPCRIIYFAYILISSTVSTHTISMSTHTHKRINDAFTPVHVIYIMYTINIKFQIYTISNTLILSPLTDSFSIVNQFTKSASAEFRRDCVRH